MIDLVHPKSNAVLHIKDTVVFAHGLDAYTKRLTTRAGGAIIKKMRQSFTKRLGFDPLQPEKLKEAGVDAQKGLVVFNEEGSVEPVVGFSVTNESRFNKALTAMVAKVDGADKAETEKYADLQIHSIGRPFGTAIVPVVSWTVLGGHALLVRGNAKDVLKKVIDRLSAKPDPAQPQAKKNTIMDDSAYAALHGKVKSKPFTFFVRGSTGDMVGGVAGRMASELHSDSITSLTVNAAGLEADSFVSLKIDGLSTALSGPGTASLLGKIEAGPAIVAMTQSAKPDGLNALRTLPPISKAIDKFLEPLNRASGLNAEKQALPLLKGPLTVAVYLRDVAQIPQMVKRKSIRGILDVVHVALTAELKDEPGMEKLLVKSFDDLIKRGLKLRKIKEKFADKEALIIEPEAGPALIGWGIWNGHYVYGVGRDRLRSTLMHLANKEKDEKHAAFSKSIRDGAAGQSLGEAGETVIVVRGSVLADAATEAVKGDGTFGLAAIVGSAANLLKSIDDISIGVSALGGDGKSDGGLRVRIRQRVK